MRKSVCVRRGGSPVSGLVSVDINVLLVMASNTLRKEA